MIHTYFCKIDMIDDDKFKKIEYSYKVFDNIITLDLYSENKN